MNTASPASFETVNSAAFDVTTQTSWAQNQWHHFALSYDFSTTTLRFYYDGELKHTSVVGPPNIASSLNHSSFTNGPFSLGVQSKKDDTAGRFLVGYIDDVALYSEVIDEEVISLWASGLPANQLALPVPEPASGAALGLSGMLCYGRVRRRRGAKRAVA
jgi:hypothetical protein